MYEKQLRMNSRSPTKSGVISSPDPREQDVIQGQSGSPVMQKYGKQQMDFVSGFDKQNDGSPGNYDGFVRKQSENANMSFSEESINASIGEEDYIGDTDGSDNANTRGVINGVSDSNQKKPAKANKKNLPN